MGLSESSRAAWKRAWEIAQVKHPGLIPKKIGDKTYQVESYVLEWLGPEWYNLSCSCKAAEMGNICHHRAIVAHWRRKSNPATVEAGPTTTENFEPCPWCVELEDDETLSPAGYHIFCEMDILAADAQVLTEHTRMAYHAKRIRDFYLKGGLNIPIDPGKRTPLDDLWS